MIKILTFNTGLFYFKLLGYTLIEFVPLVATRLRHETKHLKKIDADVMALQEVFSPKHKLMLIEGLKDVYPHHAFLSRRQAFLDNGLMVFSKFPISSHAYFPFKSLFWFSRWFAHRGMLVVDIDHPKLGLVRVINTHTDAGGPMYPQESPKTEKIRAKQCEEIASYAVKHNEVPILVAGDFNTGSEVSESNYRLLLEFGLIDACASLHKDRSQFTWNSNNPLNRLWLWRDQKSQNVDHVFVTKRDKDEGAKVLSTSIVLDDDYIKTDLKGLHNLIPLSDHYGIVAEIDFQHKPSS